MTDNDLEATSAFDVIRCVYLARTAAQRGDYVSAARWQSRADGWLKKFGTPAHTPSLEKGVELRAEHSNLLASRQRTS